MNTGQTKNQGRREDPRATNTKRNDGQRKNEDQSKKYTAKPSVANLTEASPGAWANIFS